MYDKKFPAIYILLTLLSLPVFSQVTVRNNEPGDPIIMGKIIDAETGEPVEFATISILNEKDSSLVGGGTSNDQGVFRIGTKPGNYVVKISFISYETKVINNVIITQANPEFKFGEIELSGSVQALAEVEITAERSRLEMDLDKRVFVVQKDISNLGGSATDVLDNIPSVMVDAEGNVSLRGNDGVRILINGQQSGMLGIDGVSGLKSIPANLIERVEVVTNPSARYDAEGSAGMINIILKENQKGGFNGNFDVTVGYPQQYNANLNLNYRVKDFNFFVNYGAGYREGPGNSYTRRDYTVDGVFNRLDQTQDINRTGLSNTVRFGAEYNINSKNMISGSFMYRTSDDENTGDIDYREYEEISNNLELVGASIRNNVEKEDQENLEYNINYSRTFEQKGRDLKASLRYNTGPEREMTDIIEQVLNIQDFTVDYDADALYQRSDNNENQSNLVFQADYVQPISEQGKLEVGVKSSMREISNDYYVEEQNEDGDWETLANLSNEFSYDETIHAAYLIYGNKVNRFSYQGGLRAEFTDISTSLVQTDEYNNKNYSNFFPSAHVTYDLLNGNSTQISYSRRLRRPRFRDLIPFSDYSNPQSIRSGNPDLDPEMTDSYELAYIKNWPKSSVTSSVYYRHSNGVIQWVSEVDEEGVTTRSPDNLSTGNSYGVEFVVDKEIAEWWNINGSFNFFRSIIDGGPLEEELGVDLSSDTYSWMTRANSKMSLPGDIDLQMMLFYMAPREQAQSRRKSMTSLDVALTKDILNDKATLSFKVSDVFNSRMFRNETFGENFYLDSEFRWRRRTFLLNFSYRLNQKKSRKKGGDRGGDDGDFGDM